MANLMRHEVEAVFSDLRFIDGLNVLSKVAIREKTPIRLEADSTTRSSYQKLLSESLQN